VSTRTDAVDARYWAEYDGLQYVKHQLLRKYLGGWFPILSSWNGRVLYLDCNAGRGRHDTGDEGSPILAIQTLRNHRSCSRILESTEVRFVFFENDARNYECLRAEIRALGDLPTKIKVKLYDDDYEQNLRQIIGNLRRSKQRLAPAFVFVDPYGFKISMELLNNLLEFSKCELFVNFMYRYIDLAMHIPPQADNLDKLFGSPNWRPLVHIQDRKEREKQTIALFSGQLQADYVTHMDMIGENQLLKYVLLHATNHPRGRELMKDAMWAIAPDGILKASERRNPNQPVLIEADPDLSPLKDRLWASFTGQQVDMKQLYKWLVRELFRKPHLHKVLTEYRKKGFVEFNGGSKKVPYKDNPTIAFPSERPAGS